MFLAPLLPPVCCWLCFRAASYLGREGRFRQWALLGQAGHGRLRLTAAPHFLPLRNNPYRRADKGRGSAKKRAVGQSLQATPDISL